MEQIEKRLKVAPHAENPFEPLVNESERAQLLHLPPGELSLSSVCDRVRISWTEGTSCQTRDCRRTTNSPQTRDGHVLRHSHDQQEPQVASACSMLGTYRPSASVRPRGRQSEADTRGRIDANYGSTSSRYKSLATPNEPPAEKTI
jgi:hypothetical protein